MISPALSLNLVIAIIDDAAKGGLTQFWELSAVIHCALKDFEC